MRKTRVVAATALIAASAMILGACSSSPGQSSSTGGASAPANSSSSSAAGSSATSQGASSASSGASSASTPSGSSSGGTSNSAGASSSPSSGASSSSAGGSGGVGTVGGSACGTPHGPYTQPSAAAAGQITVGYNQLASSLNNIASHDNSTYNADPAYLMNGPGLFYYDNNNNLINDDSFGTCTLESLNPLTIKYTIKQGVKWSDGQPVTAYDLFLNWAAESGWYGNPYDQNGNLVKNGVAFDTISQGLSATNMPTISSDGMSLTLTYKSFFVDYNIALGVGLPAHVVAMHALGISDPTTAVQTMMKYFQENTTYQKPTKDVASLEKIANFWNTGFDMESMPSDTTLATDNGAYTLTKWVKNQYMVFTANPNYNWGPKPTIQTIIWQYAPDPTAEVQSLKNGEIQIINPQATTDIANSLKNAASQGIKTINIQGGTYEHVDLVFDNKGPFDPASYGGNATKALDARLAFLETIPRQQIVDSLIKPLNPNTVLRDSFMLFPGQSGYDQMIAQNGSKAWDDAGTAPAIAKAKSYLQQAGITKLSVRLLYAANNPRRANEYALIAASAAKAGITVVNGQNADWSSLLSDNSKYDASLFAWQSTATGVSQQPPQFTGKTDKSEGQGPNNFGHYDNAQVNSDMDQLVTTNDTSKQFALMLDAEKHLWADGFGTLLYQYPDIVGYDSTKVTGVTDATLSPTFLWNYWDWKLAS